MRPIRSASQSIRAVPSNNRLLVFNMMCESPDREHLAILKHRIQSGGRTRHPHRPMCGHGTFKSEKGGGAVCEF